MSFDERFNLRFPSWEVFCGHFSSLASVGSSTWAGSISFVYGILRVFAPVFLCALACCEEVAVLPGAARSAQVSVSPQYARGLGRRSLLFLASGIAQGVQVPSNHILSQI